MIFLTVGTTKFLFSRMLKMVDKALVDCGTKEKLIAQVGPNKYHFTYQNVQYFSEIPFNKMVYYLSRARLVIAHAGMGTILLALKYAKNKPLIFPRSRKFNEHVDDHQTFFAKFLEKKKLVEVVFPDKNLDKRIITYIKFPEKFSRKRKWQRSRKLIKKLIEYTNSLE